MKCRMISETRIIYICLYFYNTGTLIVRREYIFNHITCIR